MLRYATLCYAMLRLTQSLAEGERAVRVHAPLLVLDVVHLSREQGAEGGSKQGESGPGQ